ncbi:hypothetical protein MIN45_P1957 [Methylomarinovum tepidoasis]|uniref:Uncharacterized protein n=1 Tax=Methylomarinovum tepidoasis TaxID=2840183 RepID=A0AAU9C8F1_9GAMM|nr:hypothetical protein [Methylomarinovum sp. IN45]BCX89584.1 hypothetical protein MIN45_P1957 [Methylomarinovum sp. IN45]
MIEPVALEHFFLFFFTAAVVIVAALCYALFYAFARLYRKRGLLRGAWLAYGVLAAAVLILARLANLTDYWRMLVILLLLGYGVAPVVIWRLCVATHAEGEQ